MIIEFFAFEDKFFDFVSLKTFHFQSQNRFLTLNHIQFLIQKHKGGDHLYSVIQHQFLRLIAVDIGHNYISRCFPQLSFKCFVSKFARSTPTSQQPIHTLYRTSRLLVFFDTLVLLFPQLLQPSAFQIITTFDQRENQSDLSHCNKPVSVFWVIFIIEKRMASVEELNEVRERYLDSLNRVNLLLLKQHDLRRDEQIYQQELSTVEAIIKKTQDDCINESSILGQDSYLRFLIQQNDGQIQRLKRKMQGQQIFEEASRLKESQNKYYKAMISNDFQNNIQHKLSTIRGKVDELKKKIKQISKETLNNEQEHQEVLDSYSFNIKVLQNKKLETNKLQQRLQQLKNMSKK